MLLMSDSSTVHLNCDQYSFIQLVSSIWRQTQLREKECVTTIYEFTPYRNHTVQLSKVFPKAHLVSEANS